MRFWARLRSLFAPKKQTPPAPEPAPQPKPVPAPEPAPQPKPAQQPESAQQSKPAPQSEPAQQPSKQPEGILDLETRRRKLLKFCIDKLCPQIEEMPKTSACDPVSIALAYAGTDNVAIVRVEPDRRDPSIRRVLLQCLRRGHDLCVSNYMLKGSHDEVLAYLQKEETLDEFLTALVGLSDSVDDHMD